MMGCKHTRLRSCAQRVVPSLLIESSCVAWKQALAREAGEEDDEKAELDALNDEADMPLDQLLARYGFVATEDALPGSLPASTSPGGCFFLYCPFHALITAVCTCLSLYI
jgi:hypothetical protein